MLHKKHKSLSFHRVCEAVAANVIGFFIYMVILFKQALRILSLWSMLQPLLFSRGNTSDLYGENMNG